MAMRPITFFRAGSIDDAVAAVSANPDSAFLAGGTTEIDLLRLGVIQPTLLVDVNELPLTYLEDTEGGGVRIGAMARMSDVARAPRIVERYPGMSQALLLGASEQLRNMASMGGNMCQRTRCAYFRDGQSPCNKREPGSGCSALTGVNRGHAVLGTSDHCIATHPSDVAVALVALDATIRTIGPDGTNTIPIERFFLRPEDTPSVEHPLAHGELIVAIDVPNVPVARTSRYVKHRDRVSYEFALVSVFSAMRVDDAGNVAELRLALGGVGTVPWRAHRAEEALIGRPATPENVAAAADAEFADARTTPMNEFKVTFAKRAIVRELSEVSS
ncbi:xanthine dehydrogenase YagS FAD-binding subunit [Asanoa hainanensis]|uniref:Xanthine dehydrogenase YagS FAD-binding subunit n=2 Tax=Asanoa hainanensis TaxID=560556 RepID=A0A239M8Y4_9ACTN|nr:xanthine dehydrogenase YagS FAD-binding subunit [Asanoa hainanensis]